MSKSSVICDFKFQYWQKSPATQQADWTHCDVVAAPATIPKNKSSEEGGEYAHVGVGVVHNKVKTVLMSHFNFLNLMNQIITIRGVRSAISYYKVKECFLYLTREILRMAILMQYLTEFGSNVCVGGLFCLAEL